MTAVRPTSSSRCLQFHRGPGDMELDVSCAQTVGDLTECNLGARFVDVADERGVDDYVPHGLGALSTAAQSRRLKKWALAKNIRSWMR